MMKKLLIPLQLLLLLSSTILGAEQICSLALDRSLAAERTPFVSLKQPTKAVLGAPVQAGVTVSIKSQADDLDNCLQLRTYRGVTHFMQLSRYGNIGRVGAIQYKIDLKPVESYLAGKGKRLKELRLELITEDQVKYYPFDLYVSYSADVDNIVMSDIDTSEEGAAANYASFFNLAQGAERGAIVDGRFVVYEKGLSSASATKIDLLRLYNSGTRELNLIIVSSAYGGGGHRIAITEGSGIYMGTESL